MSDVSFVEHDIFLGSSLGANVAAGAVLLCETALVQPRAMVMLDPRSLPLQVNPPRNQKMDFPRLCPRVLVYVEGGHVASHRASTQNFAFVVCREDHFASDETIAERFPFSSINCNVLFLLGADHILMIRDSAWDMAKHICGRVGACDHL